MCFSSFLYGPRANIIGTEVMGFIYTGFRPSHFEVMVVTDIKLVFIQILSHAQVTETMVFSSLQLSSYIPKWGLQKMPKVIFQAWVTCGTSVNWIFLWIKLFYLVRTLVPTIYMGEPVGSRQYWINYHCGTKWRLIKCRLSTRRYPESSNPILPRLTSDNEMQSPFAPMRVAAIGIQSISHAFYL